MGYKYYDTPEGEDCFPKMGYLAKNAALFGVVVAASDVILYSKPKGYIQTAGRFLHYTIPFSAMAVAFGATTCIATTVRGKDDKLNYVLGGLSSASIYGVWRKSIASGLRAAIVLSFAGYLKKKSVEEGWLFFPQPRKLDRVFNTTEIDYSQFKGKY